MYHLIDDIYERLDIVKTNQKHNYFERFIYLFDEIVDGFREAEKYLYFSSPISFYPLMNIRPGEFVEDEGETDGGESESETDEDNDENDNSSVEEDNDNSSVEEDNDTNVNLNEEEDLNENNHMEVKLD
mgnify:CR=1 FL=1